MGSQFFFSAREGRGGGGGDENMILGCKIWGGEALRFLGAAVGLWERKIGKKCFFFGGEIQ